MSRAIRLSDLAPDVRARVQRLLEPKRKRTPRPRARRADGFTSQGEADFATRLQTEFGIRCTYHLIQLELRGGTVYTPDFVVLGRQSVWPEGVERLRLGADFAPVSGTGMVWLADATAYEVSPRRSRIWRGHGSKRAQRVSIREAVPQFPWLRFVEVRPTDSGWAFEWLSRQEPRE